MTTAVSDVDAITAPGVYELPAEVYHADPVAGGSLSSTGIRKLLPPSCPALYRYERDHAPKPKREFDIGHAAHRLVLGVGPELVRIDREVWNTNAVKAEVAAARAAGKVPLKPAAWDQVHAMAAEIRGHQLAGRLFASGESEQTYVWRDAATGVWCRAMLDHLWRSPVTRRPIIVDYKTTTSAAPVAIAGSVASYGYEVQAAHYLDAVRALGVDGAEAAGFLFVFQDKEPPYLVTVARLTAEDVDSGRSLCQRGREVFRDCTESGVWPAYVDGIAEITLPRWKRRQTEEFIYEY